MQDTATAIIDKETPTKVAHTSLDSCQIQALGALKEMQASATKSGLCNMTLEEINAEINAARAERRARGKSR
jgi:hypothetical protein